MKKEVIHVIFTRKELYDEFDSAVLSTNKLINLRFVDNDKEKLEYTVTSQFLDHNEILSSLERYKPIYEFEIVIK